MLATLRYSPATVRYISLRATFLWALSGLFASAVFAQQNPALPPSLTPKNEKSVSTKIQPVPDYSKESSVIEQANTSFTFQNDGSAQEIAFARIRIQSAQAVQAWGQLVFTYTASTDKVAVDFVRVHKPDGHVTTAGPDAVQDLSSPVERVAPVYTDIRQIHITVPDLSVGDTLEYQIRTTTVHPLIPGQFFTVWNASKQVITLDETLQVNVPGKRDLHVKTANGIAAPSIQNQGDRRIYTWHSSFLKHPDDSDESKKKTPEKPKGPDVQISTFDNWAQVGQWYAELQAPRAAVTPPIRAEADQLVKGLTTPAAKVKAIYDYVSKNIRYVSLSFGLGRYQPHAAADVLANQYGDCKDKATLFEALLAAENISSYPVLINSAQKIDPDIPSPGQFDHVINIVTFDGKPHWADTTPGVAPFGFLMSQLRDKQALAMPPSAPAALQKTPVDPPFMPVVSLTVDGSVDSFGRLQGKFSMSGNGDFAVYLRTALRMIPQNYWQKMADSLVQTSLNDTAAKCTNFHFTNIDDLDQPLGFEGDFSVPNFIDLSQKDISLSLPARFIGVADPDEPDAKSTDPLKIGEIRDQTETWKIVLPAGLTASLPLAVHVTRDYGDYQSTYSSNAFAVTAARHLIVRMSQLPPARYNDYEAFRTTILGDVKQAVALANANPGNASIPTAASADDLFQAALDAQNNRNYPRAAQLYTAVTQKDPDHQGVWNDLGQVYNLMQKYSLAIPALQTAIQKNAYDPYAYNNLGLAYQGLGRYDDAVKQFQKQIEINPLDQYAHANLAATYLQQKNYAEAQKEYQTALKITPNNFGLNIGLGTADLGLHQDDAALEAFHKVLEKSPSPVTWNDVAYYLADNNSHLDLAEQYSENSIRTVEAQLNGTSLDTVGPTQAGLVTSLSAFWDTMGWIKFKQGNLKAAESYIYSAWMLSDRSDMGNHLGQIYEKEGRREDAIRTYALALTFPNPPVDMRARLVALVGEKKADTEISFAHAGERRTITLPNPQKIDADAEFWILLSPAASANSAPVVADAKFISVDDNFEKTAKSATAKEKASEKLRDAFRNYAATLRTAKFPYSFPAGESGKILLRGALACSTIQHSSCTFTSFPADRTWRLSLVSSALLASQ
ncbi:MAG TPA: DUF3857 domain-containing protein [Candidatus Acidoferrales bacterium]|nr:DUF3857 domain-containing protein [Candidatus Acidoferrales bacterium]